MFAIKLIYLLFICIDHEFLDYIIWIWGFDMFILAIVWLIEALGIDLIERWRPLVSIMKFEMA